MSVTVVLGALYFIIAALGIVGNILVLIFVCHEKRPWRNSIAYLFNLVLADLLFVTFLPFWAHYQLNNMAWIFGSSMCKFTGALTYINMYASVLFITAMSMDRRSAIINYSVYNSRKNSNSFRFVSAFVWLTSIMLSIPSFMYRSLRPQSHFQPSGTSSTEVNITIISEPDAITTTADIFVHSVAPMSCVFYIPSSYENKQNIMGALELIRTVFGFILPFSVISTCYINIVCSLSEGWMSRSRRRMTDKATTIAIAIVVVFFICWVPYHILNLYSALGGWLLLFQVNPNLYNTLKPYCVFLAYANSCINPILYAFSSEAFKSNMKEIFARRKYSTKRFSIFRRDRSGKTQTTQINLENNNFSNNKRTKSTGNIVSAVGGIFIISRNLLICLYYIFYYLLY